MDNQNQNQGQQGQRGNYPSYQEAKRLINENRISQGNYKQFAEQNNLPTNPEQFYQTQGWQGWDNFVATTHTQENQGRGSSQGQSQQSGGSTGSGKTR